MTWPFNDIHVNTAFVNPFTSDVTAETIGIYSCRVTEVAAHTPLEAIDDNEGATSNDQTQYQMSQTRKCNQPSFEGWIKNYASSG
ncbi:hypothetical protein GCM10007978_17350 [Shewanella hanedai]|nr:hypothetical protein GCM10007978_17350 [Shewanella hanedai]